jgi:hypothetical protein
MFNSIIFASVLELGAMPGNDWLIPYVLIYRNKMKEMAENRSRGAKAENNGDNNAVAPMELKIPSVPQ